jgi:hypothetical protein
MKTAALYIGAAGAVFALCSPAHAITECTGQISRIWTGDSGNVHVQLDNGLSWVTSATDPNTKNILASAIAASVSGRSVTIRFNADAVPCNGSSSTRSDVGGMWLNAQ